MTETAVRPGQQPRSEKASPSFSKSDLSHVKRAQHTARAVPAWPWPPFRLTDRLTDPAVACPSCGRTAPPNRSWCEHCGSVQP